MIDGFSSQSELDDVLRSLKNDPDVESAAQDGVVTVEVTPNDPYWSTRGSWGQAYDDLWGLKDIEADKAWNFGAGAGVIVAAYQARVMAVKALHDDGNGTNSAIAQGITWAADHGAQVINLSLGGPSDAGNVMEDAIQYAY